MKDFLLCKDTNLKPESQVFRDIFSGYFQLRRRFFKNIKKIDRNREASPFRILEGTQYSVFSEYREGCAYVNKILYLYIYKYNLPNVPFVFGGTH